MNYANELFFERHLFRLLELKFHEFKKQLVLLELKSGSVYLNTDSDLFTSMAEKIYELASDEPNGILGAVINLRIECDNGRLHQVCPSFAYDPTTMATSEIQITFKEDVTSFKRFLKAFRWYANIGKYLALHVDSKNFDIVKHRLY